MPGQKYSANKTTIKALFKKHGLKWVGNMQEAIWKSDTERIDAEFVRENDITVGAIIQYSAAEEGKLLKELDLLLRSYGAKRDEAGDDLETHRLEASIEEEIKMWDRLHKPNVDEMRRDRPARPRAPESFIKAAVKDYEEKRAAFIEGLKCTHKVAAQDQE